LENIVTIHVAQSVMFAGASYTLNCTVVSDFRPVVKWINLKGDHSRITVDEPVYHGKNTHVLLTFPVLRTSQGGVYTCQSEVVANSESSVKNATKDVIVTGK